MTRTIRPLLVVSLAALSMLAACSDPASTLDQAATERAVGRAVAAEVTPKVTATSCKGPIEQARGTSSSCTVTLQGAGELPVTVRQTDDEGTLDVAPKAAVVSLERTASELRTSLKEQFDRSFQVSCEGEDFAVRAPGSTSTCTARDSTSRRAVTVTVTDAAGTLAFAVGKAA